MSARTIKAWMLTMIFFLLGLWVIVCQPSFREPEQRTTSPARSLVSTAPLPTDIEEGEGLAIEHSPPPPLGTLGVRNAHPPPANQSTSSLCHALGSPHLAQLRRAGVNFHQVRTFVGPIPVQHIERAMKLLLAPRKGEIPPLGSDLDLFAVDGTLLNLMRWGRIVNDNDVDLGFAFTGIPLKNSSGHYYELHERLATAGIIHQLTDRERKNFYHRTKDVKLGRCKFRGSMMQCRPILFPPQPESNGVRKWSSIQDQHVLYDFFGPDSLFHPKLSPWTNMSDFKPFINCRAFDTEFPCPKDPRSVLEKFSVNVAGPNEKPRGSYEFSGCALYPKHKLDVDSTHLDSIDASVELLDRCGYPNLKIYAGKARCAEMRKRAEHLPPT